MRRLAFRVVSVAVVAAACLAGFALPVSAGGSNWVFERDHYQPGDTVFTWAQIAWAHDPGLGTPEAGPYHAYVVPFPGDGASTGGTRVPVGDLTISLEPYGTGAVRFGPHHAELRFTVPNLPPGQYSLLHANDAGKFVGDLSGRGLFWIDAPVVRATPNLSG